MTDANGIVTKYAYNDAGLVTRMDRLDGSETLTSLSVAYDGSGRPVSYTDQDGLSKSFERYAYDKAGNMLKKQILRSGRVGAPRTPPSADTQWRKSESLSHIAIIDGAIWLTQTDIASGSMTNKVYADGKGPTYGIFNVEIEDYYEWVKDDGAMDKIKEFLRRLASSAYDAAVYMQKNCGNKSFGHKESFSLECNGCCE